MALSYYERKARLPFGAVSRVAEAHGCAVGYVSNVLSGRKRNREIELKLAALMRDPETGRALSVSAAFGKPAPVSMRATRAMKAVLA